MTNNQRLVPAIAGLLAWLLIPTSAQSVDQSVYYKLSTQFRGNGMKLDVFNGGQKNNLTRWSRSRTSRASSGDSWGTATVRFAYRRCSAAPTCAWTFSTGAQTTTSHISSIAPISRVNSGTSC